MNRHHRLPAVSLLGALLAPPLVVVATTGPSHAAPRCAPSGVTDPSDLLDDDVVLDRIEELGSGTGSSLHVLAYGYEGKPEAPAFSESFVNSYRRTCAADVVLAFDAEQRQAVVSYGPRVDDAFADGAADQVREAMGGELAVVVDAEEDDFTDAVVVGIDEVGTVLGGDAPDEADDHADNRADDLVDDDVLDGELTDPEPVAPGMPWGSIGLGALGLTVVAGGGVGGVTVRRRVVRRNEARAVALAATNAAAAAFMDLDAASALLDAQVAALPGVPDDALEAWRVEHRALVPSVVAAAEAYMGHTELWTEKAVESAHLEQALHAAAESRNVHAVVAAALARVEELTADLDAFVTEMDRTPARVQEVEQLLARIAETAELRAAEGYFVDFVPGVVDEVSAELAQVLAEHESGSWGSAATLLAATELRAETVHTTVFDLPRVRGEIADRVKAVRARDEQLHSEIERAERVLSEIETSYAPECATAPRAQLDAARRTHAEAPTLATAADHAVDMKAQRFTDAQTNLIRAEKAQDSSARAIAAINASAARYQTLRSTLPQTARSIEGLVTQMRTRLASSPEAVRLATVVLPDPERHVARARELWEEAHEPRPALLSLERAVNEALATAQRDAEVVESAIREYDRVVDVVRYALGEVRDAEAYARRAGAGRRSRELARRANEHLIAARAMTSLADAQTEAEAAVVEASAAVDEAKAAIRRAEEERRRREEERRRRARTTGAAAGFFAGSSFGAHSGGGGGGGSSFGDFGGGGSSSGGFDSGGSSSGSF